MEVASGGRVDQVVRMQAFKAAHPEIDFLPPEPFVGYWKCFRDGQQIACELDLRRLLDSLDRLTAGADE